LLSNYIIYPFVYTGHSDWLRAERSEDQILAGARFFASVQTGSGAHPASSTMGTGSFPGVKTGRDVTLTPHTILVSWSWTSIAIPLLPLWAVLPAQSLSACTRVHFTLQYSYTSTPPMGRTACTEPQCLYKGALYLYLLYRSIMATVSKEDFNGHFRTQHWALFNR